jgi:hypothetical protein
MPRWRRSLSFVVLLAFAAGSIMASLSFVWCVAADGHNGIERSAFYPRTHIDHHSISGLPHHPSPHTTNAACQDWFLLDIFRAPSDGDGQGYLTFALRKVVLLVWPHLSQAHSLPLDFKEAGKERIPPDINGIARRSVVLLI